MSTQLGQERKIFIRWLGHRRPLELHLLATADGVDRHVGSACRLGQRRPGSCRDRLAAAELRGINFGELCGQLRSVGQATGVCTIAASEAPASCGLVSPGLAMSKLPPSDWQSRPAARRCAPRRWRSSKRQSVARPGRSMAAANFSPARYEALFMPSPRYTLLGRLWIPRECGGDDSRVPWPCRSRRAGPAARAWPQRPSSRRFGCDEAAVSGTGRVSTATSCTRSFSPSEPSIARALRATVCGNAPDWVAEVSISTTMSRASATGSGSVGDRLSAKYFSPVGLRKSPIGPARLPRASRTPQQIARSTAIDASTLQAPTAHQHFETPRTEDTYRASPCSVKGELCLALTRRWTDAPLSRPSKKLFYFLGRLDAIKKTENPRARTIWDHRSPNTFCRVGCCMFRGTGLPTRPSKSRSFSTGRTGGKPVPLGALSGSGRDVTIASPTGANHHDRSHHSLGHSRRRQHRP